MNHINDDKDSDDVKLSFWDVLRAEANDLAQVENTEKLYPKMEDDYFLKHPEIKLEEKKDDIATKFDELPVKPIVKNIDLNNLLEKDENKSRTITFFGFTFKF